MGADNKVSITMAEFYATLQAIVADASAHAGSAHPMQCLTTQERTKWAAVFERFAADTRHIDIASLAVCLSCK